MPMHLIRLFLPGGFYCLKMARKLSLFGKIEPIKDSKGYKRFTKKKGEFVNKQLPQEELQKRYNIGLRIKKRIELLEEMIIRYEKRIEELSKTPVFKEMNKNMKLIKSGKGNIKFEYKKFMKLFE